MNPITEFVKRELYPNLFSRVRDVFPSMDFQQYKGGWSSRFKLDGTLSHDGRKDKSVITPRTPHRIIEQGGESIDLITLYKQQNSLSRDIDAISAIASIMGLQLPTMEESESYRAYIERQNKLEALALQMAAALYTDEGAATLTYLRQDRGYSDEFIKAVSFGYCSSSIAESLTPLFRYQTTTGESNYLPQGVGSKFILSIPYRAEGGEIKGFIFRSISSDSDKYRDSFIEEEGVKVGTTRRGSKSLHLFGLTHLTPIAASKWDKVITIVEGEIDALRAQYETGKPNVVATSGSSVYDEALKEAKQMGATGVTLLFDTEATPEKRKATTQNIARAIEVIQRNGLTAYIAELPQEQEGVKVDVDSYLRTHTGKELTEVIAAALPSSVWKYYRIEDEVKEINDRGELQTSYLEESKRRTIALMNEPTTSPTDRGIIAQHFSELWGNPYTISKEDLMEEADRLKGIEDKKRQKAETLSTISEAYQAANSTDEGGVEAAINLLQEKLPQLRQINRAVQFGKLLLLPTAEGIRKSLQNRPTGIATNFIFGEGDREERLILPSGALTYICAPTSHGKSRMLQNLALNVATDGGEGDVLYFSFEEDSEAVKVQLLNTYINETLTARTNRSNNLKTLWEYYRDGSTQYIRSSNYPTFQTKEEEFMNLLTSGKLRIFYEDWDSTDLIEGIRYLSKQIGVRAVFIDYIQLLHKRGSRLQRKDELKEICKDLMNLSIEIAAPVILAAQLNREALSPIEMAVQNIAEASDIEHSANIVMLLWNSNTKPLQKSSYFSTSTKGKGEDKHIEQIPSPEAQRLIDKGFKIGEEGKLYALLAKNRGGYRNIDAILNFDGNTGKITQNTPTSSKPSTSTSGGTYSHREDDML